MASAAHLNVVVGDAVDVVVAFVELAPGILASAEVFEGIMREVKVRDLVKFRVDVPGFSRITTRLSRVYTNQEVTHLNVTISCMAVGWVGRQEYFVASDQKFPFTIEGTMHALEFLKAEKEYVIRSGLCGACLASEPPLKRLRIQAAGVCACCVWDSLL